MPNRTEQTNFHSKRGLEANPHPSARHVLDPTLGRALGLDIANQSDFQVCSADRDAQTRHFEGSLGLATLHAELVSAPPDLVSPGREIEERTILFAPGMRAPVCTPRLLVVSLYLFGREMGQRGEGHRP